MKIKRYDSSDTNVFKYVFEAEDKIYEAVLYRYGSFKKRTVICCSVQSGCPVGCTFCGTGKQFIKNLTTDEIINQIDYILDEQNINSMEIEKFQIMFMSMGEPFLNYIKVDRAIRTLNKLYSNAQLLVSTIGVKNDENFFKFLALSTKIDEVGLQFSIHKSTDEERSKLIPYKNKYTLREIRDRGMLWHRNTGRKVYLNYCIDNTNNRQQDIDNLKNLFSPLVFNMTFSVICETDETLKDKAHQNLSIIQKFEESFIKDRYNTRIFDPAGQDDIGAGCGTLWHVQEWMKNNIKDKK